MQPVVIGKETGSTLSGNLFLPKIPKDKSSAVLLLHGWESAQDRLFSLAERLAELGYICLTVDLRGHGETPGNRGELSRKDFLNDAFAAYDFLATQTHVDVAQISVVGSSFGAYLAALLTAQRAIAWLVMRVPADYEDETFELPRAQDDGDKAVWRTTPRSWESTAALRAVHAFEGQILLVEAGRDEVVPKQTIINYKSAAPENIEHHVMEGAPHSFTGSPHLKEAFNALVVEWLERRVIGRH